MELSDFKVVYTEEAIKERLSSGDVHFTYRKKDGTEREAYGTRNLDIITRHDAIPSGNGSEGERRSIVFTDSAGKRFQYTADKRVCMDEI